MDGPVGCGRAGRQSAALAPLPEVEAGLLAAGVELDEPELDGPEPDEELSEDDEELEDALSEAVEVLRLSVR